MYGGISEIENGWWIKVYVECCNDKWCECDDFVWIDIIEVL